MNRFLFLLLILSACAGSSTIEETWVIHHEYTDCMGVGPMQCLRVKKAPDAAWELFYDNIDGFDYREGNIYTIRVSAKERKNPPADASSMIYSLVEIIEVEQFTPVTSSRSGNTQGTGIFGATWVLESYRIRGIDYTLDGDQEATFKADGEEMMINGQMGCNKYFGQVSVDGNRISFAKTGSTQKVCADEILNRIERDFTSLLLAAREFEVDEKGNLQISCAPLGMMEFRPSGY